MSGGCDPERAVRELHAMGSTGGTQSRIETVNKNAGVPKFAVRAAQGEYPGPFPDVVVCNSGHAGRHCCIEASRSSPVRCG